ncbi:MAG TPA: insulinase family protein, partial [Planctomycetota bacterium]|nr:insulinase family protein [Planctomycetota bacterium]
TVERYFARLQANRPEPPPVDPPVAHRGEKRIAVPVSAQPIYISIHRRPSCRHDDDPVYHAIADLLAGGPHSRMHRAVVKTGIAAQVDAAPAFPGEKYSTGFTLFAVPSQGRSVDELERVMDAEVARLAADGPSEAELDGVRLRAKAEFLRGIESNAGLARELARHEAIAGGWRETFRQLARIEAVTSDRVRRVASSALVAANRTVATIAPQTAAAAR